MTFQYTYHRFKMSPFMTYTKIRGDARDDQLNSLEGDASIGSFGRCSEAQYEREVTANIAMNNAIEHHDDLTRDLDWGRIRDSVSDMFKNHGRKDKDKLSTMFLSTMLTNEYAWEFFEAYDRKDMEAPFHYPFVKGQSRVTTPTVVYTIPSRNNDAINKADRHMYQRWLMFATPNSEWLAHHTRDFLFMSVVNRWNTLEVRKYELQLCRDNYLIPA